MAGSRVTIKDLAEKLNLSTSTISRALHNHPTIGKKTIKDVHELATQMGYLRNSVASNLRRNKTNLIGIIVPRIDINFHSRAISGIEEVAYKSGYNITICQSNDSLLIWLKV
jgi:LacI family transcriptional regulator